MSGIFRVGLIIAEFATSLKSPKKDTAKNKPYYMSSLRVLEIAKMGLSENLTHFPSVIFAKISRREKFPIYGMLYPHSATCLTKQSPLFFQPHQCATFTTLYQESRELQCKASCAVDWRMQSGNQAKKMRQISKYKS